jgi:hypothetical protein
VLGAAVADADRQAALSDAMSDIEKRVEALEQRLRLAEDTLAIYQLVATYGPGVDSLSGEVVGAMWTEDGVYDSGGLEPFRGRRAVGELVNFETHQGYVAKGCAHVMSLPHVVVDGDRAVATGHSRVYIHEGDQWRVVRASSNRWELVRTREGWKVELRTNRLLNGEPQARELFAQGIR